MIIEAFPVGSRKEYNKRLTHMGITGASMVIPFAAFITGVFTHSENSGILFQLWLAVTTVAMPKALLDSRALDRLKKLDSSRLQTTYTRVEPVASMQSKPKGKDKLLRLLPPGLREGILARRFR